jgi:eukaryotic-like serine/threonine-protein kinase
MMAKMAASLSSQRGFEDKVLLEQSKTAAYLGQLGAARELSRRIEDEAMSERDMATVADVESDAAFREALCGTWHGARNHAAAALTVGGHPGMALALAGESVPAMRVSDRLANHATPGGFVNRVWLPEIQATIELKRGNPMRAVELLASVTPYEEGWFDNFLAAYLRGQAYLAEYQGREAAVEFQKILDHRGIVLNEPIGVLAHLQLGRAYAMQGDTAKAKAAYQDFLTLWKDADPDIPVLIAAKAEYAKLK